MAESDNERMLYLFYRPGEPLYVPKGEKKEAYKIPRKYLPKTYHDVADEVFEHFKSRSASSIMINEPTMFPDLKIPMELDRRDTFSLFIPRHRRLAGHLIKEFMEIDTYEELFSVAAHSRDCLNPAMFIYALSVALLHREDTKHHPIPSFAEMFPDNYVDPTTLAKAKDEAQIVPPSSRGKREPIEIPRDYTASDRDEEHRVAYWREDVGINLHHWHWHLVYPYEGDERIVKKDRRGELFYYMHQQIMARYNIERLCNNLGIAKGFDNIREPIPEGYFPKLNSIVVGKTWPSRPSSTRPQDIHRPVDEATFSLDQLECWRDTIYKAICERRIFNAKEQRYVSLNNKDGIDILGNILEASILSPHPKLYGDLHNSVHLAISCCHDPDHRYLEHIGIMGNPATAMRDPIFYRWHTSINDIFMAHKNTLPAYEVTELGFAGIEVSTVELITPNSPANSLMTFWTKSDLDLSIGLDFAPTGPILVRYTHLNHVNFTYRIIANNQSGTMKKGTVRIFVAPNVDEDGCELNFETQKDLMIEMDKFTVSLSPGDNLIEQPSTRSSVTIPFERTFRKLDSNRPAGSASEDFNFCGCGWPQHMLVPKGNEEGFPMDLFVMISDFEHDVIKQSSPKGCSDASSFCGLRDLKYPDARSMGYPFDRKPRPGVKYLPEFLTPNMATVEIAVRFSDIVKPKAAQWKSVQSLATS